MLFRLLLAFIFVPLIELFLLLRLADATSVVTTISIVIVTGIIGSWLAKREGTGAMYRFRSALAEGRMPGLEIQDGLMIVFAAALLLTPGLLTDALGFTLLAPKGRDFVRRLLVKRYSGSFKVNVTSFRTAVDDTVNRQAGHRNVRGDTIDATSVTPKQ